MLLLSVLEGVRQEVTSKIFLPLWPPAADTAAQAPSLWCGKNSAHKSKLGPRSIQTGAVSCSAVWRLVQEEAL